MFLSFLEREVFKRMWFGEYDLIFRHIVPSPQRIIKHIPMCKTGKEEFTIILYIYII